MTSDLFLTVFNPFEMDLVFLRNAHNYSGASDAHKASALGIKRVVGWYAFFAEGTYRLHRVVSIANESDQVT